MVSLKTGVNGVVWVPILYPNPKRTVATVHQRQKHRWRVGGHIAQCSATLGDKLCSNLLCLSSAQSYSLSLNLKNPNCRHREGRQNTLLKGLCGLIKLIMTICEGIWETTGEIENGETANVGVHYERKGAELSAFLNRVRSPYTSWSAMGLQSPTWNPSVTILATLIPPGNAKNFVL